MVLHSLSFTKYVENLLGLVKHIPRSILGEMQSPLSKLMSTASKASYRMTVEVGMLSSTFWFGQHTLTQGVEGSLKAHFISLGNSSAFPVVAL